MLKIISTCVLWLSSCYRQYSIKNIAKIVHPVFLDLAIPQAIIYFFFFSCNKISQILLHKKVTNIKFTLPLYHSIHSMTCWVSVTGKKVSPVLLTLFFYEMHVSKHTDCKSSSLFQTHSHSYVYTGRGKGTRNLTTWMDGWIWLSDAYLCILVGMSTVGAQMELNSLRFWVFSNLLWF